MPPFYYLWVTISIRPLNVEFSNSLVDAWNLYCVDITELFSVYTTQKSKRLDCPHYIQFQVMQFQTYLMFQKFKKKN